MQKLRLDLQIIAQLIEKGSKILDIGCGEGDLLLYLKNERNVSARGIESDPDKLTKSLKKGLAVTQGNIDYDLKNYPTNAFDYTIISQTLQVTKNPKQVMKELQRISKKTIVAIPNFAYIENRLYLTFLGRMPVTKDIPYKWYNTPNIHFCTIADFITFAKDLGFILEKQFYLNDSLPFLRNKIPNILANTLAKYGIYLLKKGIMIKDNGKKIKKTDELEISNAVSAKIKSI